MKRAVMIILALILLCFPLLLTGCAEDVPSVTKADVDVWIAQNKIITDLQTASNNAAKASDVKAAKDAADKAQARADAAYAKTENLTAPSVSSLNFDNLTDSQITALKNKLGISPGLGGLPPPAAGNNVIPANVTFGQFIQLSNPTIGFGPTQNISQGQTSPKTTAVQYGLTLPSITNNSNAQRQVYIQGNFSAQFGNPVDVSGGVPLPVIQNNSWITWTITHLNPASSATGPWSWSVQSSYFNVGPGTSTGTMNLTLNPPFANSAQWVQSWILYVVN